MLSQIANVMTRHETIAVLPHINPDGDCLGSAVALCDALRGMGKNAFVCMEGEIPENLSFLQAEAFFGEAKDATLAIAVDCADAQRLGERYETVFCRAKETACMDHHDTNRGFGDFWEIQPDSAATGEMIYLLLTDHLKLSLSQTALDALYAAISSDTGSFQYQNTTERTHAIAGALIRMGANAPEISKALFDTMTLSQMEAQAEAIRRITTAFSGKVVITFMDHVYLAQRHMRFEDVDFLSALPRRVLGAEVGIYLKDRGNGEIKVSLRSNRYVNVAEIAAKFGGGGHIRAAGATLPGTREQAVSSLLAELEKVI